ncbi:hypothetical protein [Myroides injenensis]|uniref:hypothetical protein n=1 Tax=Myroides injenensis TaxID=1183151 RepID=UPI0002889D1D|nr:hypothetical protein [Myroides injenensis]
MRFFFLAIFFLSVLNTHAQDTLKLKFINSETIPKGQVFISKDMYDSSFIVNENTLRKVTKYNSASYSNSSLGELTSVDVTLPMFPILFYKESQMIVNLNKDLGQMGIVNFAERFPNMSASYVGNSVGRKIWLFDSNTGSVYLYNNTSYERHTAYKIEAVDEVKGVYSTLNNFFWIDKDNKLNAIDVNGKKVLEFELDTPFDSLQILGTDKIIYSLENKLYYIDLVRNKKFVIDTKEKSILGFFYSTQKMSIFTDEKLNNYFLKLP